MWYGNVNVCCVRDQRYRAGGHLEEGLRRQPWMSFFERVLTLSVDNDFREFWLRSIKSLPVQTLKYNLLFFSLWNHKTKFVFQNSSFGIYFSFTHFTGARERKDFSLIVVSLEKYFQVYFHSEYCTVSYWEHGGHDAGAPPPTRGTSDFTVWAPCLVWPLPPSWAASFTLPSIHVRSGVGAFSLGPSVSTRRWPLSSHSEQFYLMPLPGFQGTFTPMPLVLVQF